MQAMKMFRNYFKLKISKAASIPKLMELENRVTPSITALNDSILVGNGIETRIYALANDLDSQGKGIQINNLGYSFNAQEGNTNQVFPSISPAGPSLIQNADNTFTFKSGTNGTFTFPYSITSREVRISLMDSQDGDQFGTSISASGDGNTLVIGAPLDNVGQNNDQGSVVVFKKIQNEWVYENRLLASDGVAGDAFGASVSVSFDGNTVVIGAPGTDGNAVGATYVFSRNNNTWVQEDKLQETPGGSNPTSLFKQGSKVLVSEDGSTIFSGTEYGAQNVYHLSGNNWVFQADLGLAGNTNYFHPGNYAAISADGNTILLGYEGYSSNNTSTGATFAFYRTGNTWGSGIAIAPANLVASSRFGASVGISADGLTAIIGAPGGVMGNTRGGAFIFEYSNGSWVERQFLSSLGNELSSNFGGSVAISRDGMNVLSTDANVFTYEWGAYFFNKVGNSWQFARSMYGSSAAPPLGSGRAFLFSADGNEWIFGNPSQNAVFTQYWPSSSASVNIQVSSSATPNILGIQSDTGFANNDGITTDQNISVFGKANSGDLVRIYNGPVLLGTTTTTNTGDWNFDLTGTTLAEGKYFLTATGEPQSGAVSPLSPIFQLNVDNSAPTGNFAAVTTPRNTPVPSVTLQFSEPVYGLTTGDFLLTRNGRPVFLTGAYLSGSGTTYQLNGLQGITTTSGSYTLSILNTTNTSDIAGNPLAGVFQTQWLTDTTPILNAPLVQAMPDTYRQIPVGQNVKLNVLANDVDSLGYGLQQSNLGYVFNGSTTARIFPTISPAGALLTQNPDNTFSFQSNNPGLYAFEYTMESREVLIRPQDGEVQHFDPITNRVDMGDQFGQSFDVSADGNTMVVGAPRKNVGANQDQGMVYIYSKNGNEWVLQTQISGSNGLASDLFGNSVSVSDDGNVVAVGAPGESGSPGGAFYVYRKVNGVYQEESRITENFDPNYPTRYNQQGKLVVISGDGSTVLVGTDGGLRLIYGFSNGSWNLQTSISPQNNYSYSGQRAYAALSTDGNTAVISFVNWSTPGEVFIYTRSNGIWAQTAQLNPQNVDNNYFGSSVAISGDGTTVAVGCPNGVIGNPKGNVFVFRLSNGNWSQSALLYGQGNQLSSNFGIVVGISRDGKTIFAKDINVFTPEAGCYFFRESNNNWFFAQSVFGNSSTSSFNFLGEGVALSADGNYLYSAVPSSNSVYSQYWQRSKSLVSIQVGVSQSNTLTGGSTAYYTDITNDGNEDLVKIELGSVLITQANGNIVSSFQPYKGFQGAIHVSSGDFDGNGRISIVTSPGFGGGPHITLYDPLANEIRRSFFAYSPLFTGGVFTAVGDLNQDGISEIVTAPGPGGGPNIRVFDGRTNEILRDFMAYAPTFTGGVTITLGDINNDGRLDIITGAGAGGAPHVKAFDFTTGNEVLSFMAYDSSFRGGVYVAFADIAGNGSANIITGTGFGGGSHVKVFDAHTLAELRSIFAYDAAFTGGVRVAVIDRNHDGVKDILTAAGPTGGPHLKVFDGETLDLIDSFFVVDPSDTSGVFLS